MGTKIDCVILGGVSMSLAAAANVDETGIDPERDVTALRCGEVSKAVLLARCLDGADEDRSGGWRDYVEAVALAAMQMSLVQKFVAESQGEFACCSYKFNSTQGPCLGVEIGFASVGALMATIVEAICDHHLDAHQQDEIVEAMRRMQIDQLGNSRKMVYFPGLIFISTFEPDEQCPEHGCAQWECEKDHDR